MWMSVPLRNLVKTEQRALIHEVVTHVLVLESGLQENIVIKVGLFSAMLLPFNTQGSFERNGSNFQWNPL